MYVYRPEERFKSPPILPPHLLQVILNKDTNISVGTSTLSACEEPHWGWKGSPVCWEPGLPLAVPGKSIAFPLNHTGLAPCSVPVQNSQRQQQLRLPEVVAPCDGWGWEVRALLFPCDTTLLLV